MSETLDTTFKNSILANEAAFQKLATAGGSGTLEDPATELSVTANPQKGTDANATTPQIGGNETSVVPPSQDEPLDVPEVQVIGKRPRYLVTDPRIQGGAPTPFDTLGEAKQAAGTPDPLAHIEEQAAGTPFADTLKTAEQKDAAKNFVELLNIPVEHLAGFVTKGDITQTATPEELGSTILSPVESKLKGLLDDKQMGLLATAVGVLGMMVIDPMNPALSIAGAAKSAGKSSKLAVLPGEMDSKRFKTVTEDVKGTSKSYEDRNFPVRAKVRVEWSNPKDSIDDEMDGLNVGHILRRAADNWESADRIQIIGVLPPKDSKLKKAFDILKSERGSFSFGTGEGGLIPRLMKKERDPRIDEGFKQAFDETVGFEEAVQKQRRGTLSDETVLQLSKKSDLTLEAILDLPPGTTLPAEQFHAVRNVLKTTHKAMVQSARDARELDTLDAYQRMFNDLGTVRQVLTKMIGLYAEPSRTTRLMKQDLPKPGTAPSEERGFRIADPFINELYQFFLKMEQTAKAQPAKESAEAAAARARKEMLTGEVDPVPPPPQSLRDFAEAVAATPSEEELMGFMKALETPTGWDVWLEQWYNGMLLGLAPIKNLVGTPAILAMEIAQRGVMAGLDAGGVGLVRLLTDGDFKRSVYMGEVGAMLNAKAMYESFMGGARLAWHAFKTGKPQFDQSALEHTVPEISNTALWLNTVGPLGQGSSWLSTSAKRWQTKGIDLLSTTGGRLLLAGDTFNKFVAHQAQLRALALREAYSTVEREGLEGVEAVQRALAVKRDVMLHPERYPELNDSATQFAQYVALQQELGESAESIGSLAQTLTVGRRGAMGGLSGFPIGRWMHPFNTIMANAGKMAGEYSGPLQLLSPAIQEELRADGPRRLAAMAKISFSTMMLDSFYTMASEGLITGNGPRDKNANRQWQEATGKIPNAWWNPVTKQYQSCTAFEPFCTVTSAVADLNDMMSYTPPDQIDKLAQGFQSLAIAIVNNAGVKAWTQGLVGTINVAQSGDFDSYDKWFKSAVASSAVPYAGPLRQISSGLDPHLRRATTMIEMIQKDIPMLSAFLPMDRNGLGKPLWRKGGWWDAFSHGLPSQDPDIWQALNAHNYVLGKPSKELHGVKLDDRAYDQYIQAVTDGLDESLRLVIEADAGWTDEEFAKKVNEQVERHRKQGTKVFLDERPDLMTQIEDRAEQIREGERKKPSKFTPGKLSSEPPSNP